MKTRVARQEGRFYPGSREGILRQIRTIEESARYPVPDLKPTRIFGAVLPHAGHMYSGYQTIPFFQVIREMEILPETIVILHPNHSGSGHPLEVDEADFWVNSLGRVPADMEFAASLDLPFADTGLIREHSAEVILPFIQYYLPAGKWSIVALCMRDQRHDLAAQTAKKIHDSARELKRKVLVIASCDFSHFLTSGEGARKDQLMIDEIMAHRSQGVEKMVRTHRLSVCGYGPVMTLMNFASLQDPDYSVRILARGHSGEVHPSTEVVDYISIMLYT